MTRRLCSSALLPRCRQRGSANLGSTISFSRPAGKKRAKSPALSPGFRREFLPPSSPKTCTYVPLHRSASTCRRLHRPPALPATFRGGPRPARAPPGRYSTNQPGSPAACRRHLSSTIDSNANNIMLCTLMVIIIIDRGKPPDPLPCRRLF